MKNLLLASALAMASLAGAGSAAAQNYVPFDFYGFQTNADASAGKPNYQRYVVSRMMHNPDTDDNNFFIQRSVAVFDSFEGDIWDGTKVTSCFMRNDVLYAVRYKQGVTNSINTYDAQGVQTNVANLPTSNGYVTHAAYVEEDDMVYMVLATPTGSTAALYKAPGSGLSNLQYVNTFAYNFEDKPYSFTYVPSKKLFYYVTNSGDFCSLTAEGETALIYNVKPQGADMPSDDYKYDYGSGLVWSEPYNMLIWTHPREGGWCHWYGLDPDATASKQIIIDQQSGTSASLFNCMMNQGIEIPQGVPATPTWLSCYPASGKSGWYDLSWPAIFFDVDGNELEEEVTYNIYISEHLVATAKQPTKGQTASVRFLLPWAWEQDTFYVSVQAMTESGVSGKCETGPIASKYDPENQGGWLDTAVEEVNVADFNVAVNGNMIEVSGLNGETAQIVAIDGKVVSVLNNDSTVELPAGLYIVNAANKSVKVMVK